MKYDARACHFNMDTSCVELLLRDGRKISIDCTGVEDALDISFAGSLHDSYADSPVSFPHSSTTGVFLPTGFEYHNGRLSSGLPLNISR